MIKDSGERTEFKSGAVRDMHEGKGRFDLLPMCVLMRLARHYENGCAKYGDRNWEKGIPCHSFADSAMRHLVKYMDGQTDEDHLIAAIWNLCGLAWTEEKHPEMMDIPARLEAIDRALELEKEIEAFKQKAVTKIAKELDIPEHVLTEQTDQASAVGIDETMNQKTEVRYVTIPAKEKHEGLCTQRVLLRWVCPKCGGPRGKIEKALSYDGSLSLQCDGWTNPCNHVDYYADIRKEAAENGLNGSNYMEAPQ